jgi:hypothetical protein
MRLGLVLPGLVISLVLLSSPATSQVVESGKPTESDLRAREALGLRTLQEALSQARSLTLPENRGFVEAQALSVLWDRDDAQARSLVTDMQDVIASLRSRADVEAQDRERDNNAANMLRAEAVGPTASHDPALALDFLRATKGPEQAASPQESDLEMRVALELARQNAEKAADVARNNLDHMNWQFGQLVTTLESKDPSATLQLVRAAVAKLKDADLSHDANALSGAVQMLQAITIGTPTPIGTNRTPSPDDLAFRQVAATLSDMVGSALAQARQPLTMFGSPEGLVKMLQVYTPARAGEVQARALEPDDSSADVWHKFNRMSNTATLQEMLGAAEKAPEDHRGNFLQQVAMRAASAGDYVRAQQIAAEISDPNMRSNAANDVFHQAAVNAANAGQFDLASDLAVQIASKYQRINLLIELSRISRNRDPKRSLSFLDEARSLLPAVPADYDGLNGFAQLANAEAEVRPARSAELLAQIADVVNEKLPSFAALDGFVGRSFVNGELLLLSGGPAQNFFSQMIWPLGALAEKDPAAAFAVLGRVQRPEVRLAASMAIAQRLLNTVPARRGSVTRLASGGEFILH